MIYERLTRYRFGEAEDIEDPDAYDADLGVPKQQDDDGELVGSLVGDDMHQAIFDVDGGVEVVPSRTPGNHHLYFDKQLTWRQYRRVMRVLGRVGLVDPVWARLASRRGQAFLRRPRNAS